MMFMKKFTIFLFLLSLCGVVITKGINQSYAFDNSYVDYPVGVTTLNGVNYIKSNNVLKVCSYEYCYDYKGGEMKVYLKDFAVYLDSVYEDDYKVLVYFKGYPITKIYYVKD